MGNRFLTNILKPTTWQRKKSIYLVQWHTSGKPPMAQPVKAASKDEAETKFAKICPKVSNEDITHFFIIEPTHKHYRLFNSQAK